MPVHCARLLRFPGESSQQSETGLKYFLGLRKTEDRFQPWHMPYLMTIVAADGINGEGGLVILCRAESRPGKLIF
jgi:hypothetical protein